MVRLIASAAALAAAVALSAPVAAQDDQPKPWELESELGASVFFGASQQTAVLLRSTLTRNTERLEFTSNAAFDYGEAQAPGAEPEVNKRSWLVGTEVDYEFGMWSPFLFATSEGSFERGIDLRINGGVGARLTFIESERSKLDLSAAVLGERTDPRSAPGTPDEIVTLARGSARLRATHDFEGGKTNLALLGFYKPALDNGDDYTVDLEASVGFRLNGTLSFKLSLVNRYDNLATSRGAIANNDGRLFFSVVAQH